MITQRRLIIHRSFQKKGFLRYITIGKSREFIFIEEEFSRELKKYPMFMTVLQYHSHKEYITNEITRVEIKLSRTHSNYMSTIGIDLPVFLKLAKVWDERKKTNGLSHT